MKKTDEQKRFTMENIKLKKMKPILQLKYPKVPPDVGDSDYRESLFMTKQIKVFPEWDKARNSTLISLIHAKYELQSVTKHLKVTRQQAATAYKQNDIKWKELHDKEVAFQQSFQKFEAFVVKNNFKQKRAIKKIKDEVHMQQKRKVYEIELRSKIEKVLDLKQRLEAMTKEYRIYEDFLHGVIMQSSGQFKQPVDIIKRHESLVEKKNTVLMKRNKDLDDLDEAKSELVKLIDVKHLQIMELNRKVVKMTQRHEEARRNALKWELIVSEVKHHTESKQAELDCVKKSISNTYKHMAERQANPPSFGEWELEAQCVFINRILGQLQQVYNKASGARKKDYKKSGIKIHKLKPKFSKLSQVGKGVVESSVSFLKLERDVL